MQKDHSRHKVWHLNFSVEMSSQTAYNAPFNLLQKCQVISLWFSSVFKQLRYLIVLIMHHALVGLVCHTIDMGWIVCLSGMHIPLSKLKQKIIYYNGTLFIETTEYSTI